ncbi:MULTISPECIES: class I SAM-dependent methyltransferase [unclassified Micromonospora]|uniref:class I SAM-dependent methyltransferase n=1 Tax=unclassified Micromonospora TaxID=2617518 RepID=UPI00188E8EF4|nr:MULTISPECIES: class I SAM-dependent methyltransferase [unclassified Micromonospora]MBF5029638.1 class I SAM-dependent methyltransferase [Micromonospora sp. ANENR4]MCZ7473787.1 class I SAM-dependent methyltransferase [Micromonospora sp. WMMC273]WBC04456.1 class I SAM-dependent methyltransferase [Micromonospora sp. WMMA1976]
MIEEREQDAAVKARHRAMWAMGDYAAVAAQVIPELGATLVRAAGVAPGMRVLDVAAGTGNAALPAARAGAEVVAGDLTPELLAIGRAEAEREGLALTWEEADAEALPYADGAFDAVLSCVGVMFAPRHRAAADEVLRVCRPGGTIGLVNWTPEGFVGQLFAAMRPFAPPPPPGAQPPPLWGDEDHVRELFGDRVDALRLGRDDVVVNRFATPEQFRDFFATHYGPTVAVYRANAGDPERTAGLDRALTDLAARHLDGGVMRWEYLLVTARRA